MTDAHGAARRARAAALVGALCVGACARTGASDAPPSPCAAASVVAATPRAAASSLATSAPVAAGPTGSAAAGRTARHLLLITVDSLRADMPWVGYGRPIAPRMTALARQSVVYTHAYALSSYTSMSLGGLMAARHPSELERDGRATSSFGEANVFFAEVLRAQGFRTVGAHGHVYFAGNTGIRQGFEAWRLVRRVTSRRAREGAVTDDELAELVIEELTTHARDPAARRLFLWVHFMDPHFDYVPHREVRLDAPAAPPVPPGIELDATGAALKRRWETEIAFTDRQVGRVLDTLAASPLRDDTLVVLTADHGEAFGEKPRYFEHGFLLYEVTVRVPLLFHAPWLAPRTLAARRSHLDLARTLAELLGVPLPETFRGASLVPELRGEVVPPRDVVIDMPYTDQSPRRRALVRGDSKLIVTESSPRPELYDLARDATERTDLAEQDAETRARLQAALDALDRAVPDYPAPRRKRGY
ncbi:MAG: sulfatase [Polyangiaceae bacterium]|nr:sulfatase [Polyangiaceae bacterium]